MRLCRWLVIFACGILGACQPSRSAPTEFDRLQSDYARYMDKGDPLAFPMKLRAVAASPVSLWRGDKELFFRWCGQHAHHLLDDAPAYMVLQGDQHLGNIGTYLIEGPMGASAFGMVDFDESHRLPFQFELLQGLITLRLTAQENGIDLTDAQERDLAASLLETYRDAAASGKTATELLAATPDIAKMLQPPRKRDYEKELAKITDLRGHFLRVRATRSGQVKDILEPALDEADAIAQGIADALTHSPDLTARFRYQDAATIRRNIRDIARRTHISSAGSQGLRKYFVLLSKPLAGIDHDAVFYLKQQIPSAPERAGIVPQDTRPPGQRYAHDMALLCRPAPAFNSWCTIGNASFWLTIREPWTEELDEEEVRDLPHLREASRIWAIAAGATHSAPAQAEIIRNRTNEKLLDDLLALSHAYIAHLDRAYENLVDDPRLREQVAIANDQISRRVPAEPRDPPVRRGPRRSRATQPG